MKKISSKQTIIGLGAILIVLSGWYFRYDVTSMRGDFGAVSYMNRWTGKVIVVNQFGNSSKPIYLSDKSKHDRKAEEAKLKIIDKDDHKGKELKFESIHKPE